MAGGATVDDINDDDSSFNSTNQAFRFCCCMQFKKCRVLYVVCIQNDFIYKHGWRREAVQYKPVAGEPSLARPGCSNLMNIDIPFSGS